VNENRSKSPSVVSAGVVVVVGVEITGSDTDSTPATTSITPNNLWRGLYMSKYRLVQDICNRLHRHVLLAL
jgi:hypothetical protein